MAFDYEEFQKRTLEKIRQGRKPSDRRGLLDKLLQRARETKGREPKL